MKIGVLFAVSSALVVIAGAGLASAAKKAPPIGQPAAEQPPIAWAPTAAATAPTWVLGVASGQPTEAWRLNTQTGELDVCTVSTGAARIGYVCTKMPEPSDQ